MLGSASRSNAEAVYAEEPAPGPSPLQYPPTYPLFISARLSQNNSIAHSPLSAFSVVPRFQSARLPLTIPVLPNRSVAPPRSISTIAPPRSPTASRSPHKKAPGKRARSAAPPDPAPPTTRSTKRARLTAEDVELEDEEIKEAFDDVPADDQSRVPGEWSPRTQRAGSFVDPEVCVSCALSGQVCTFTASSRSTSCAPCILSHSRCHKAPRKT
ncbi:hypothetical protein M3J07_003789 [Ascochyta lentis]